MPDKPRKAGLSGRPPASNDPQAKQPAKPKATTPETPTAAARRRPKATRGRTRAAIDWAAAYLAALSITGEKTRAARAARKDAKTIYRRRLADVDFADAEKEAMKIAADAHESEATRRAVNGITETRYDPKTGKKVSQRRVYSDTLLLRLLVRNETGSWRESSKIEHGGAVDFTAMTRAERMKKLAEAEAARAKPL